MSDAVEKVAKIIFDHFGGPLAFTYPSDLLESKYYGDAARSIVATLSQPRDAGEGWRSMDSAPKDGTPVDLWCRAPGLSAGPGRVTDCWNFEGKWWRYDEQYGDDQCRSRVHNASQWRPLPAAPSPSQKEDKSR